VHLAVTARLNKKEGIGSIRKSRGIQGGPEGPPPPGENIGSSENSAAVRSKIRGEEIASPEIKGSKSRLLDSGKLIGAPLKKCEKVGRRESLKTVWIGEVRRKKNIRKELYSA